MALFKAKKIKPEAEVPAESLRKPEEKKPVEEKPKPKATPEVKPAEPEAKVEAKPEEPKAKLEEKAEVKSEARLEIKPTPTPAAAPPAAAPSIGVVSTPVDEICELLEKARDNQKAIEDVAKELKLAVQQVEAIGKILAAREAAEIIYPMSPLAKPMLKLLAPKAKAVVERGKGDRLFASYSVSSAGVPANVEVWDVRKETRPLYSITIVKAGAYTEVFLDYVREELAREVPVLTEEITDPKLLAKLKERFHSAAKNVVEKYLPMLDSSKKEILSGILLNRIYGLGDIELLMADDWLEEVAVNTSVEPIGVYHKKFGWLKTNLRLTSEEEIYNYASQIGRKAGRDITLLSPILDAPLITGDRAAASLFPISSMGNTITIRRFARMPWTITQFMSPELHTISSEMAAFLWLAVEYEMNVLVTGGTASGKCVGGDTKVLTDVGLKSIREIVEKALEKKDPITTEDGFLTAPCDVIVYSLNPHTLKIESKKVEYAWKRKAPEHLLRIITRCGKKIDVTPEHPFFTINRGIQKKRADEISAGEWIATPRKICFKALMPQLPVEKITENRKVIADNETNSLKIKSKTHSLWTRVPTKWNEELARFAGYMIGDGHITKDLSAIRFFNKNSELLEDFRKIGEKLFEVKGKYCAYNWRTPYIEFSSSIAAHFLADVLGIPAGEKSHSVKAPTFLLSSGEEYLREFVIGLFESEASVKRNGSVLEFSSASKELAEDVQFILTRFGIQSIAKTQGSRNRVFVGGKNLFEYARQIGFFTKEKSVALRSATARARKTNFDFVPEITSIISELKKKLHLFDREIAGDFSREAVSRYVCGARTPTRSALSKIAERLERRYKELLSLQDEMQILKEKLTCNKRATELIKQIYAKIKVERKVLAEQAGVDAGTITNLLHDHFSVISETINSVGGALIDDYFKYLNEVSQEITGFDSVRTIGIRARDIAAELGVKEKSVYPYFENKRKAGKTEEILKAAETIRARLSSPLMTLQENIEELKNLVGKNDPRLLQTRLRQLSRELKIPVRTRRQSRDRNSQELIEEISSTIAEAASREVSEKIAFLKKLAESDILWDEVVKIECVKPSEEWVYDLTVEGNHTFVANNVIAHNTSSLNVITTFIPPAHRIVSAEDTREVLLPSYMRWNWIPLVTRGPNPEGKGEVSMLDLMVAAMRMRPDRIVVGEVRRRREAEVMFEAMHTGHSVYCTLHADTAAQAIRRLTEPPIEIPATELQALQLIVTQYRDRRTGIRRIYEITEIVPSPTAAGEVSLNTVYKWRPRTDAFEKVNESARVVGDIAMHTGMTLDEIRRDVENKRTVLEWALNQRLVSIEQVGELIVSYYKDRESVVDGAKRNLPPEKILLI